jgi:protein tyrosine/serine phosphatase
MPYWVIDGVLATSPRPGFVPGAESRVGRDVVERWLESAQQSGIRSIICLLDRDQLWLYPSGLLERYRAAGFAVAHIPTMDRQTNPFTAAQLEQAWESFLELPKPVLVHCSAGYDRTGRVVDHILANLERDPSLRTATK